jgi:hypothetical protein
MTRAAIPCLKPTQSRLTTSSTFPKRSLTERFASCISGGAPYGVDLPFAGADPVFEGERHGLPFVDYLRLCLRWAGFPGLEAHASDARVSDLVARLTEGFVPF